MARRVQRAAIWIGAFLILAQAYRPQRVNPPVDPSQDITSSAIPAPEVTSVLERACNDCHSNRTTWPWYSKVAPASWLVASDVNRGRRRVNFSEWSSYGADRRAKLLSEVCNEVKGGEMPPLQYTLMHSAARLSDSDRQAFCRWAETVRQANAFSNGAVGR